MQAISKRTKVGSPVFNQPSETQDFKPYILARVGTLNDNCFKERRSTGRLCSYISNSHSISYSASHDNWIGTPALYL